jgi:hypothetical protein
MSFQSVPQTTLAIFDFDYSLYRSPLPPAPSGAWWMSPRSLDGYGPPGFDPKWILGTVQAARKSQFDPFTLTALLTGRAAVRPMKDALKKVLTSAGLEFDLTSLKPVRFPSIPQGPYKAATVRKWLLAYPSIKNVVLFDDEQAVHDAVQKVVTKMGRSYRGVKMPDPPRDLGGLL